MRRALGATIAIAALLTVAEATLTGEAHHPPGLFAAFAILGAVGLVAVAKGAGKVGLERPEPPIPPEDGDE